MRFCALNRQFQSHFHAIHDHRRFKSCDVGVLVEYLSDELFVLRHGCHRDDEREVERPCHIVALLHQWQFQCIALNPIHNVAPSMTESITALGIGAILGVLQTALAALLLVVLITRRGAIYFAQVNYLVPVFGALVGIVFLGERVGPQHVIGITVILISLAIAQARMKLIRI